MPDGFHKLRNDLELAVSGYSAKSFPSKQRPSGERVDQLSDEDGQDTDQTWPTDEPPYKDSRQNKAKRLRCERGGFPKSRREVS